MINSECAKAYTEVVEILKYIPINYLIKVPREKIEFYKAHMDPKYDYKVNKDLDFQKQPISEKAKAVLANLFKDYWATTEEKEKMSELEKYEYNLLEEQKKKQYNQNSIFKNVDNKKMNSTSMTGYKEKANWYDKFILFIKRIFKK